MEDRLEAEGMGYRCRKCGISVFAGRTDSPKLCSACETPRSLPPRSLIQEQYERAWYIKQSLR